MTLPDEKPLQRFTIIRQLGHGGMGIVYLARDAILGREVALKLLTAAQSNTECGLRFEREVELCRACKHPNIVKILSYGVTKKNLPFYAMEYIDGATLDRFIANQNILPAHRALNIAMQMADAFAYLHERGILHRDVKPQNVFLSCTDHVTLVDFGLAWSEYTLGITREGQVLGTPTYLTPEMLSVQKSDARSDLYQLGLLLYALLTGRHAFWGTNYFLVTQRILNEVPTPLRALNPRVPPALAALVMRLIEKEPDLRPKSARALLEELLSLQD